MKKIIKYSGVIIIVFLFFNVFDFYAQSCSWRSYIDLPTSSYSEGFCINLNSGYAIAGDTDTRFDANGSIEYGIGGFVAGLKVFTEKTFCLDLAYQLNEQSGLIPSFSFGIENITYSKYVAPIDTTENVDFMYSPRPPEVASAYLVATDELGGGLEVTVGLGRGRFVGYGPRSGFLNFDNFFDDRHENFMFGVFGGIKYTTPIGASFIVETDGRDANAGIQYGSGIWKGTLSLDKMEHFFTSQDSMMNVPWLNLSLSFNPGGAGTERLLVKTGKLKLSLKDKDSGAHIPGKVIISKGNVEKSFDILPTQRAIIRLQAGIYKVTVFSAGYKMKTANIPLKAGSDLDFTISLSKVINPAIKRSMDLTKEGADYYKRGLLKQAKEKLEEAITLYPNNKKAQKGLELVRKAFADNISELKSKAWARERAGDIRGAIAIWEQVISWEENPSATQKHIQSLRDKLVASTRKPVTRTTTPTVAKKPSAPKKPSLTKQQIADLYTKGLSAYFDGNYKEAVKYFEQVLKADPTHAQAKRYLGEAKKH